MLAAELVVSAVLAVLVCVKAKPIAAPIGLLDLPDGIRKQHQGSIPMLGGFAVLPGLIWSVLAAEAGVIVAIALLFFSLGLLDDLFKLSAWFRLVVGSLIIAFILNQSQEMVVDTLSLSFGWDVALGILAVPFTCLCILGFVNAINMVDGTNGLLVGLSVLWTGFLLLHAVPYLDLSFLGLFAALIVTLAFNIRGKIFLGDSGACMLGATIAAASIWVYNLSPNWKADGVVVMFVIPVIDCLRVMCSRIMAGRSPMRADRGHLHQLLAIRWPKGGLLIYWSLIGVPNILAIWFPDWTPVWLASCLLVYAGLIIHIKHVSSIITPPLADRARSVADYKEDKSA